MSRIASKEEEKEIIIENRHNAIVKAINAIPKPNNKEITDAINNQGKQIELFSKGIGEIAKAIKMPEQKEVDLSQLTSVMNKVVEGQDKILKNQDAIIEQLKILNVPKEYSFQVFRDYGNISKVVATPVINKSKYQA